MEGKSFKDEKVRVAILRINNRYFRKVMAHPDGAIVHFGDCKFYSTSGVCTCGLIHDLMYLGRDIAKSIYEKYDEDLYFHERNLDLM